MLPSVGVPHGTSAAGSCWFWGRGESTIGNPFRGRLLLWSRREGVCQYQERTESTGGGRTDLHQRGQRCHASAFPPPAAEAPTARRGGTVGCLCSVQSMHLWQAGKKEGEWPLKQGDGARGEPVEEKDEVTFFFGSFEKLVPRTWKSHFSFIFLSFLLSFCVRCGTRKAWRRRECPSAQTGRSLPWPTHRLLPPGAGATTRKSGSSAIAPATTRKSGSSAIAPDKVSTACNVGLEKLSTLEMSSLCLAVFSRLSTHQALVRSAVYVCAFGFPKSLGPVRMGLSIRFRITGPPTPVITCLRIVVNEGRFFHPYVASCQGRFLYGAAPVLPTSNFFFFFSITPAVENTCNNGLAAPV